MVQWYIDIISRKTSSSLNIECYQTLSLLSLAPAPHRFIAGSIPAGLDGSIDYQTEEGEEANH